MFNLVICDGIPFDMSVLYVEFLDEFQRSKAETTLVQSVCTGVFLCAGNYKFGWLFVLRIYVTLASHFSDLSAISRLGSRR